MAVEYPYIQITQKSYKSWDVELITRQIDVVMYSEWRIKHARTRAGAEAKGKKMLARYRKKYGNLADPYRIR